MHDRASDCPVAAYADDVLHGSAVAGPHVRAECRRHLRDIRPRTCAERGWRFDAAARDHILGFFPGMLHLVGQGEGRRFELDPFQRFILGRIYGFVRDDGHRRFRYAYIETSRGSGKSPLAAGIALYSMLFDGPPRSQTYMCGSTREQALITFKYALGMVEQSDYLSERIPPPLGGEYLEKMICPDNGSIMKSLAFHPTGKGTIGLNPYTAIVDELHEHTTAGMLESMTSGFKYNKNALCIMLTNSGVDKDSVCYHERSLAIEATKGSDRRLDNRMAYVCAVDKGDDPLDDRTFAKTNPALRPEGRDDPALDTGIPTYAYLRERRDTAVKSPSKLSAFLRFNACHWTESYGSWLGRGIWKEACRAGAELKLADYRGRPCYGGADLALRRCMTAMALVFPSLHPEYAYDVFARFWMAAESVLEAERRDHREGLYTAWIEAGHIAAPPGGTIDYRDVARYLGDIGRAYEVRGIAYDRRYVDTLTMEFPRMDAPPEFPLAPHPQGFAAPSPAVAGDASAPKLYMPTSIKRTELLLRRNRIRVAPNPVLSSHVAAAVAIPNARLSADASAERAEEIRLGAASPGEYIDGAIALVQAIGYAEAMQAAGSGPSVFFV